MNRSMRGTRMPRHQPQYRVKLNHPKVVSAPRSVWWPGSFSGLGVQFLGEHGKDRQAHSQAGCDASHVPPGGIDPARLQVGDPGWMDFRAMTQLFLAPASIGPQLSDRMAETRLGIGVTGHQTRECASLAWVHRVNLKPLKKCLPVWTGARLPSEGPARPVDVQMPKTRASASSTARSSSGSRRPAERPRRCGSTTVVCSTRTRVSIPSRVIVGRKLAERAPVEVGETSVVLNAMNSSA